MKIENLCCVTGFERKIRLQLLLNFFSYFFKNAFIFSSSFSSWWWMLIFWSFFRAIEAFSFLLVSGFGRKFTLILFYSTEEEEKEGVANPVQCKKYYSMNDSKGIVHIKKCLHENCSMLQSFPGNAEHWFT